MRPRTNGYCYRRHMGNDREGRLVLEERKQDQVEYTMGVADLTSRDFGVG